MGVLHGALRPHADRPPGAGGLDDTVIGLGGPLAVQVKDLSDAVGSLQDFDLGLGGTLSRLLRPPDDLDALDVVGDGKGLDGAQSSLRNGTLHGVLGVGVPHVLGEIHELLGALEARHFGTENGGKLVAARGGDLERLLPLGKCEHGLEGCLGTVLEVDVHHVEETDGTFPAAQRWHENVGQERQDTDRTG